MKEIVYTTSGVCSRQINIILDDNDVIESVSFVGGCNGNLQGVSKLCQGKKASEVISILKGIKCGLKQTSCPDQLARALESR